MRSINSDLMNALGVQQISSDLFLPFMNEHPSSYTTAHVGRNAGVNKVQTVHIPSNSDCMYSVFGTLKTLPSCLMNFLK